MTMVPVLFLIFLTGLSSACCPGKKTCCGKGCPRCCPEGYPECESGGKCCPKNNSLCNGKVCCDKSTTTCTSIGCCPTGYPVPCGTKTCCIKGSTCVNGSCVSSKNSKTSSAKVLNGHEAETGKIMTRNIGKYIRQQIKAFDEVQNSALFFLMNQQ